jgi:hypothetical protein
LGHLIKKYEHGFDGDNPEWKLNQIPEMQAMPGMMKELDHENM